MIDRQRLVSEFLELASTASVSKREGQVAKRLVPIMEAMGARVEMDDAGHRLGGDCGNLIARFEGTVPSAPPFLLSAHMDTVVPGENVRPVLRDDIIKTDGTTVLGGDDKSGIVAILEAIRVVKERRIPHGAIEVVLTICEEIGLVGAKHFDVGRLSARSGLVLDCDGVDELITRAPAANRVTFTVHGLEAHAGVCPERGLSAIKIAGEAIAGMRLGRLDEETTANLGVIEGGMAGNIVPNRVTVRGETRSLRVDKLEAQTAHMRECFERAAAAHRVTLETGTHTARVEARIARDYERLFLPEDAAVVRLVKSAAEKLGRSFRTRASGGGSDANVFNAAGLQVANLGCGMRDIHTVNEWIDVKDMVTTSRLLVETLRLHAESPA